MYLLCFVLFIIMKVVLQILIWNFNESCASNPDLELHHVNFVMKLMYMSSKQTHKYHLISSFELCYEIDVCALTQTLKYHSISSFELCYEIDVCALTQTHKYHLISSFELCYEIEVCAQTQTHKYHLNSSFELCYKIAVCALNKPSNFIWTSNFTAVFVLMFSPTWQKAKFKRKIISIHTNSLIIITCPNPVLLVI